ncbi:MAG: hypothetical protein ACK53Y_24585, partial [bacterium]
YKHLFFLFKVYYSYCLEYICRLICKFFFFLFDGEGGRPTGRRWWWLPPGAVAVPCPVPLPLPPPQKKQKKNMGKLGGMEEEGGRYKNIKI